MLEGVVEQAADVSAIISDVLVRTDSVVKRIFGCWHRDMTLPFTRDNESYRACVACGARRSFDLEKWEMVGSFYYPERNFGLYAGTR